MDRRASVAIGMAAGAVWAAAVVWIGVAAIDLPVFSLLPALAFCFLAPGLVLLAMIGRLAAARFFDDHLIDGGSFAPGSRAEIDQRVLANTVEQLALALCLWPPSAYLLLGDGSGVLISLGLAFALSRIAFWVGCRRAPALRAFGFAATFYATIAALVWSVLRYLVG